MGKIERRMDKKENVECNLRKDEECKCHKKKKEEKNEEKTLIIIEYNSHARYSL